MSEYKINGVMFRDMILVAASLLERNKATIDALNVFPVPDGDTGTNMSMTMNSAAKYVKDAGCDTVSEVAQALSSGALRGARGNSGVILSQIFRGFARALKDADEIDCKLFIAAFSNGCESAYKAVMRPKEGTILTVIRLIAEALKKKERTANDIHALMNIVLEVGEEALKQTPELLPVLKEAGVVDSGGTGLMTIMRGFNMALDGEEIDAYVLSESTAAQVQADAEPDIITDAPDLPDIESIKFPYCTEFFVINLFHDPTEEEVDRFREKLVKIGDSVVVAYDTGFIKVHVHSTAPGKILQLALRLGEIDRVKIENMLEQNREMQKKLKDSERESAIVAVGAGDGIETMFRELGANAIISGGQTMNPSIESIQKAIRRVNARNVFVLPNNSNIILAATQAAELFTDRRVIVVPTKSIMQGISAITAYNLDFDADTNARRMTDASNAVIHGSVTYAVRTTTFEGRTINEGDILAMLGGKIVATGKDVFETSSQLLREMMKLQPDEPVITMLYGEGLSESDVSTYTESLEEEFPEAEFIMQYGGQSLYYFYFSIE